MTERRVLATLALVAVLGASCSGTGPDDASPSASARPTATTAPTTGTTSDPTTEPLPAPPTATEAPRPERGTCHSLTFEQALSPTADTDAFGCKKTHTTETYAVGTVDNLIDGHLLAVDSRRVQQQVATTCPAALSQAVGGSRDALDLSMLRAVWFTPTVEEYDAGADWYRCDVLALAGADRLMRVRGSLTGVLNTQQGRDTYGMCGTAGPDSDGFRRVPCSESHAWRAFSVIRLAGGAYPGRAEVARSGQEPCREAAADVAADPLDYQWAFEGPDAAQWRAGQTFIRCWKPD